MQRTFRFGLSGRWEAPAAWQDLARKAEDLGFSTLLLSDHFEERFSPVAPLTALVAAAAATTTLRVGTLVINNDFRHPAVLAKEVATVDVLSGGRFELGLGSGSVAHDYEMTGMQFDPMAIRVDRLIESIQLQRRLWTGDSVDFDGKHYHISGLLGSPRPVQTRIPILIGAGGPRMLRLAAAHADIINIRNLPQSSETLAPQSREMSALDDQVALVREVAAGRYDDLELSTSARMVQVTDQPQEAYERMAAQFKISIDEVKASPTVLVGTIDQMCERLVAMRDQLDLSYFMFGSGNMDAIAPLVAKLRGT